MSMTVIRFLLAAGVAFLLAGCGKTEKKGYIDSLQDAYFEKEAEKQLEKDLARLHGEETEPETYVKAWNYDSRVDDMDSGISQWAWLKSDNFINMEFPYHGDTYATVTVRKTKEYGTDVYVKLDRGQFGGNSFKGTNYVRIRFDDAQPVKYKYNEAADGSTDVVFLRNAKDFIAKAKKAKRIKVEVNLWKEGNRVFDFSVDESLKW